MENEYDEILNNLQVWLAENASDNVLAIMMAHTMTYNEDRLNIHFGWKTSLLKLFYSKVINSNLEQPKKIFDSFISGFSAFYFPKEVIDNILKNTSFTYEELLSKKKSEIAKMFGFDAFISYTVPGTIKYHFENNKTYVSRLIANKREVGSVWNPFSPYLSIVNSNAPNLYSNSQFYYFMDIKLIDEVEFHFSHYYPRGKIASSYRKCNKDGYSITDKSSSFMLYLFLNHLKNDVIESQNEFLPRFSLPLDPYLKKIMFFKLVHEFDRNSNKLTTNSTRVSLDEVNIENNWSEFKSFKDFIKNNYPESIYSFHE